VNAFTDSKFRGNPAAVVILDKPIPNLLMQSIATENNLPVTAFIWSDGSDFQIRWFTPEYMLSLCGHGLFAASYILFAEKIITSAQISFINLERSVFTTNLLSNGTAIEFTAIVAAQWQDSRIPEVFECEITESFIHEDRGFVFLKEECNVMAFSPNFEQLRQLKLRGITISAPSDTHDFITRTFYPSKTIKEDAVCGVAHRFLAPYWGKRLGLKKLKALQGSHRGGEILCEINENFVSLIGQGEIYLRGSINF
jgi:predicted PhzF superfamily epimerase YddE/YHI9